MCAQLHDYGSWIKTVCMTLHQQTIMERKAWLCIAIWTASICLTVNTLWNCIAFHVDTMFTRQMEPMHLRNEFEILVLMTNLLIWYSVGHSTRAEFHKCNWVHGYCNTLHCWHKFTWVWMNLASIRPRTRIAKRVQSCECCWLVVNNAIKTHSPATREFRISIVIIWNSFYNAKFIWLKD
jgi:hypothetical protein